MVEVTVLFSKSVEVEMLGKEGVVSSSIGPDLCNLDSQNLRSSFPDVPEKLQHSISP